MAVGCKRILAQIQINDVEIASRESVVDLSPSPPVHSSSTTSSTDPTTDVRGPFTPALDLQIAAEATPHCEGNGGLYICRLRGGQSNRIFPLTAGHVVLHRAYIVMTLLSQE